ncbi:MAG: hypothetical protein K0S81_2212 [Rhodospirillales bacterium]|nr:hypothetical protein [Rhodospirillales bacterium]
MLKGCRCNAFASTPGDDVRSATHRPKVHCIEPGDDPIWACWGGAAWSRPGTSVANARAIRTASRPPNIRLGQDGTSPNLQMAAGLAYERARADLWRWSDDREASPPAGRRGPSSTWRAEWLWNAGEPCSCGRNRRSGRQRVELSPPVLRRYPVSSHTAHGEPGISVEKRGPRRRVPYPRQNRGPIKKPRVSRGDGAIKLLSVACGGLAGRRLTAMRNGNSGSKDRALGGRHFDRDLLAGLP